jgi:hypothetical protein
MTLLKLQTGRHNLVKNIGTIYVRGFIHFFKILGATLVTWQKFRAETPQIFSAILKIYSIGSPEALDL